MRGPSIVIVTWNSEADIVGALGSLRAQTLPITELVVVDNASRDRTLDLVRRFWPEARIVRNAENRGFAAAANQGIDATRGSYVLLLNPDAELGSDFIQRLVARLDGDPRAASACGKLRRFDTVRGRPVIDSAGMAMTCSLRHLDRGQGEIDRGQYDRAAYVFGGTGAALLLRRAAIDAVRVDGQAFDERFHSYREDADLAWRLRLAGWQCVYDPKAVGRHRRRVTPEARRRLPEWINRAGVRNRFLMRANNMTCDVWRRTALPALLRDLIVVGACLTVERSSLSAFHELAQSAGSIWKRRRAVQALTAPDVELAKWFGKGYVEPLPEEATA